MIGKTLQIALDIILIIATVYAIKRAIKQDKEDKERGLW